MELIIGIFSGIIAVYLLIRDNVKEKNSFREEESKRYFENNCKVDSEWNSAGRVYTRGMTLIEENGKKKFIRQAKLCDTAILH